MLTSFRIQNYRIFQDVSLDTLGRINLLVGANNSGKSCFLEAIRIYGSEGRADVLEHIVRARREDVLSQYASSEGTHPALQDHLKNLFPDYRFPSDLSTTIQLGPLVASADAPQIQLRLRPQRVLLDAAGRRVYEPLSITDLADLPANGALDLECRRLGDDRQHHTTTIRLGQESGLPPRWQGGSGYIPYVPAGGWNEELIWRHWYQAVLRPSLKREVISAIQLIDPEIQDVVLLEKRDNAPEPIAVYSDDKQVPLRGLGDGIGRIFQMMVATVVAGGKQVTLDEFENGLHWSIQPQAWKLLFQVAARLDVQVFATTHSSDCIRAFWEADAASPEVGAVLIHLGRSRRSSQRGQVIATTYAQETLAQSVQLGLELR